MGLNPDQRAAEVGRTRTALLALLVGGIAVVGAIYTARTFALNRQAHELDRQGQITERFTRAVDQLGNKDSLDVRLGGIYALERLARESRDDHGPIMEILTAYVREHAPQATRVERASADAVDRSAGSASPPAANDATGVGNSLATDVQAVLTVLGRRTVVYDTGRLDLRAADLSRANLIEANLQRAWLPEAKLIGANLVGANLKEAYLGGAHLQGAYLNSANLQDTLLGGANLQGATLGGAKLQGANLTRANLANAILINANLEGAFLSGANLQGASLHQADLRGANLSEANLDRAALKTGDLYGAAYYDSDTNWPEGFDPSGQGALLRDDGSG